MTEERFKLLPNENKTENTQKKGLTTSEAMARKKQYGANELPERKGRTSLSIFLAQFKNPLIYIISVADIISIALGEYNDAVIITLVIILDSFLGFFQEHRAEKTVIALRRLLKPMGRVIRNGETVEISAAEIVPDDIVSINDGDKVPADGELIEVASLNLNEAILTGESEPVAKKPGDIVYMGTTVLTGRGLMHVTCIGKSTELGKIAKSLAEVKDEPTPLQMKLESFGRSLTYLVLIVTAVIFAVGLSSGVPFLEMVRVAVVLAIAAIPEGLPIAVTMILIIGMRAVLRRKGLIKKLLAVETLGSVSVICTDKTGTLTEGTMKVVRTSYRSEKTATYAMILCNNIADPLEVALLDHVKTIGLDYHIVFEKHPRTYEVPFSSENKYMLTTNLLDGIEMSFIKGAPEIVMEFCNIPSEEKKKIASQIEEWASSGLKLLALAYKQNQNLRELRDFTWLGLIGIEDPVRPGVKDAISLCRKAGIKVKIVTGDYRGTAVKVAAAIGLDVSHDEIIEGKQLEQMTEKELAEVVENVAVFARVSPHHKLKIITALQTRGEVTAMIGDGVNDAPALKKSNIGISVGNATDVAQETAGLILLDNNFRTLVNSVEEGRIIFENIKKVVAYVLSNSFAEIFTIFGAMILGWPSPLSVAQILWIHLICDGPSDIVLGFERGEEGIMAEKPKSLKDSILDGPGKLLIVSISLASAASSLAVYWYMWQVYGDIESASTIVFTVLAVQELIYIFAYRSFRHSLFRSGNLLSNKPLFGAVALGFVQQILALYVPFLNNMLGVVPLHAVDWALVLCVAFIMLLIVEAVKYVAIRRSKHRTALEQQPTSFENTSTSSK